jgi:hypothetical protein
VHGKDLDVSGLHRDESEVTQRSAGRHTHRAGRSSTQDETQSWPTRQHTMPSEYPPPGGNVRVPQPSRKSSGHGVVIGVGLSCVALLVGLYAAFPRQFQHQLQISLVRQPTPYTQLYFTNLNALSGKLLVDKPDSFAFTIENDQGQTWAYEYTVTVSAAGSHTVADVGALSIPNGTSVTRTFKFVPKSRRSRYLVTVSLSPTDQSIHFYGDTP